LRRDHGPATWIERYVPIELWLSAFKSFPGGDPLVGHRINQEEMKSKKK
jgi:hypothetical protein